jgi:hypothetical protein
VPLTCRAPRREDFQYIIDQVSAKLANWKARYLSFVGRVTDGDGARKYHAISWDKVLKPKSYGGLGLRRLDVMNQACIHKLGWKLSSGSTDWWCEVMRGKYDSRALKG